MNDHVKAWQADARRAFDWMGRMYDRSKVAMDDAEGFFEESQWSTQFGNGMGGVCTTTVLDQWPFVYLRVFAALPPGMSDSHADGRAALFGILFHDGIRQGPALIGGCVHWSDPDATCDHWMTYAALGGDGPDRDAFDRNDDLIRTAIPNKKGKGLWLGVERFTWFEMPLGAITSPEILRSTVEATKALVQGDEAPARELLRATR